VAQPDHPGSVTKKGFFATVSHQNVEIVRRAVAALDRRDLPAALELIHPEAELDWSRGLLDPVVLSRCRDEHLAGPCVRTDARRDVNGDAADVVPHHLALAGVETGPHLDAQRFGVVQGSSPPAHGASLRCARQYRRL